MVVVLQGKRICEGAACYNKRRMRIHLLNIIYLFIIVATTTSYGNYLYFSFTKMVEKKQDKRLIFLKEHFQ